jgi:hypothetical protein
MKIVITESQKRRILLESASEELGNILKRGKNFVKETVDELQTQFGIDAKIFLSFSASVTGFMGPITQFLEGKFPQLTEEQFSLILIGITATYFIDNQKHLKKIYDKIREEGLSNIFEKVLKKSDELRNALFDFLESLNFSFYRVSNMLSFAFIIPLISPIINMVHSGSLEGVDMKDFATRIISYAGITISGILFKNLLIRLIRRFKEK